MKAFVPLAFIAACTLVPSAALATPTITFGGSSTTANNGTAPGSATDYAFYGNGGQPSNLTNFSVSTSGDTMYPGNGGYSNVAAPGSTSAFTTGIAYDQSSSGQNEIVASFSTPDESSFDVYILDGNTDGNHVGNSSVGLGYVGGTEILSGTLVYSGVNEFSEFTVTGATPGTVFEIYAEGAGGNYSSIGGVTFGPASAIVPTPEPGSLALLGTGLLGAVGMMRRRRA